MNTSEFSVGFSRSSDPVIAVEEAWSMGQSARKSSGTDCIMIFSTSAHNPHRVSELIKIRTGPDVKTMGGYGIGFFGHGFHAHGGVQLALVFVHTDQFQIDLVKTENIHLNQHESGKELACKMSELDFVTTPDMLLFYDSINRKNGRYQINCCQYLIDGMAESLEVLPENIAGAGFYGDILGKETSQWFNHKVYDQLAFACLFSGQINMRTSVISGSYPISPFLTVTRSHENRVLEINGQPATDYIMNLILPGESASSADWRKYAFYVTLGVRTQDRFDPITDDNYLVRLCSGIDLKNKALIMFEPDLTEGTVFQLMKLEIKPESIKQKVSDALKESKNEKVVFALYIDCGARASAYCGLEPEEGLIVRDAIGTDIPFLGLYIGVESVKLDKIFRPLDWSGVLCLFSIDEHKSLMPAKKVFSRVPDSASKTRTSHRPSQAPVKNKSSEAGFYKSQLSGLTGTFIRQASEISKFRHRHHQYESALQLISSLQAIDSLRRSNEDHITDVLTLINNNLHFDQSCLCVLEKKNQYLSHSVSVPDSETVVSSSDFPVDFLSGPGLVAMKSEQSEAAEQIRAKFKLRCFVAVPIRIFNTTEFVLISGRDREIEPFVPALNQVDLDIFRSLSGYLSSSIQTSHLYHSLDNLVVQRTEELEKSTRSVVSILKNISSGIFTISEGGVIDPLYSDALHDLLETDKIASRDPVELLFGTSDADQDRSSLMRNCFSSVGSPILEWKLNQHHLPATTILNFGSVQKTFKLNYDPILSKGCVEKILVSISDMTQIIELKAESEQKSLELNILSEVLEAPAGALDQLLTDIRSTALDPWFKTKKPEGFINSDLMTGLKRDLHTLKGNARSLKFICLGEVAHKTESDLDRISSARKGDGLSTKHVFHAMKLLKNTLNAYEKVSRIIPAGSRISAASPQFSQNTLDLISENTELKEHFRHLQAQPKSESLKDFLMAEANKCLDSNRPQRSQINFHCQGDLFYLPGAFQSLIRSVLGHLIRNSVAHSLPHISPKAALELYADYSFNEHSLVIRYHDSGRGLCINEILDLASKKGLKIPAKGTLTKKVETILLASGFSTSSHVDHLSGRGVGLDAVRHLIEAQKGSFHLRFLKKRPDRQACEPFEFIVTLPLAAI